MTIFIDETELQNQNDYAYCAVAIEDRNLDSYRLLINTKRIELQNSPFFDQFYNIKNLKKSFHYTQDHREVKNAFIAIISKIAFESFIHIFHQVGLNEKAYSRSRYILALDKFLKRRYRDSQIKYIWEKDVGFKVEWPPSIDLIEKQKEEDDLIAIADYSLGIFRKVYVKDYPNDSENTCKRDYAFIENKIRYIKDDLHKKPYTRRNPLIL